MSESSSGVGHWKQARGLVEARIREALDDPLANFLLSQIRNGFGDRSAPLTLAEKTVALDERTAKYHRQLAEVEGVMAQHANAFQEVLLARPNMARPAGVLPACARHRGRGSAEGDRDRGADCGHQPGGGFPCTGAGGRV
jgi:hypothetical protein